MAGRKKTTTTIEEEEEVKVAEEYDAIHKPSLEEVVTEAHTPVEEDKPTETPKEDPKEEVKKEEETEEVEFDPKAFKQEVADETSQKIVDALKGGSKEETKENVNAYQKFAKDVWEKEGRNPTWDEVLPLIEEAAVQRIEAKQQEKAKAENDQREQFNKEQETKIAQSNAFIGQQLADLQEGGRLPKIKDENNSADPGIVARHALLQDYTQEITSIAEANKGKEVSEMSPIPTVKEFFFEKFRGVKKQVAGADAPIGGGDMGGAQPANEDEINYKEMHSTPTRGWINKLMGK